MLFKPCISCTTSMETMVREVKGMMKRLTAAEIANPEKNTSSNRVTVVFLG
jgi:hypothetical protein